MKIPEEPAQVRAQGLPGPALATTRITVGQSIDGVSLNYDLGSDISDHKSEALSEASLPFLDLWDFDIRRWRLAFRVVLKSTTMVDAVAECIRNFPRLGSPVKQWPLYVGRGITGLVYGGLHCLAWDAPFPTDMERLFWRISSVTVTSTGLLIALGFSWAVMPPFWTEYYGTRDRLFRSYRLILDVAGIRKRSEKERPYRAHPLAEKEIWFWQSPLDKKLTKLVFVLKIIFDIMIVLCAVFYALARLYLVVECFISLAHLPEAAYQVPRWSQYVPHIA